jgi:hypothetical protein
MKEFVTLRIAIKQDGTVSVPAAAFDTQAQADDDYCDKRKLANGSTNVLDTVMLMTNTGFVIESKTYDRRSPEPEPQE